MHALDFENCTNSGACPHLAALATRGVTYTRASAAKPSDSFPGLMNIVTGGTPKTHGAFYDLAYDRSLAPPVTDTGNGLLHDYYSQEINSNVVGLPGVMTPPTPNHPGRVSCAVVRDPSQLGSWTDSFTNIRAMTR